MPNKNVRLNWNLLGWLKIQIQSVFCIYQHTDEQTREIRYDLRQHLGSIPLHKHNRPKKGMRQKLGGLESSVGNITYTIVIFTNLSINGSVLSSMRFGIASRYSQPYLNTECAYKLGGKRNGKSVGILPICWLYCTG